MATSITFLVNEEMFPKSVLLRTCYTFIDLYYIYLDSNEDNRWQVTLRLKKDSPLQDLDELEGEFNNALLNEAFREALTEKTKLVKEVIVARALFGADNSDSEQQTDTVDLSEQDFAEIEKELDDYLDDPLGIAVPWEEKHGNKEE